MNEHEQPIFQVIETYKAAVQAKDVDRFVALYDPDVVVFDMWGTWSYQGIAAWRSMVVDWFGSLGSERVMVAVEDVHVMTEHGIAMVHALVTYQGVSAEGEALRAMQNRFTWVLHKRAGSWKIIHEHSSAPVDFETSKVMLQRL